MKNKSIRMIPILVCLAVMIPLLCSAGARRTVAPQYVIGPKDTVCTAGGKARLAVSAPSTRPEYQWQVSTDGGETWRDVSGGNAASVTLNAVEEKDDGALYRVTVKNGAGSVTSSSARLTVTKAALPSIQTQPKDAVAANGEEVAFSIKAKGNGLAYQWQFSKDNGETWSDSSAAGYDTATISLEANSARNGYLYRCVVKNTVGDAVSDGAKLTVSGVKPVIRVQPKSVSSAAGKTVEFTVIAAGTGLSYRWQYSKDNGSTWANSSAAGYDTATLSVEAAFARNGYLYRCVVQNAEGSETSNGAKLTVVAEP